MAAQGQHKEQQHEEHSAAAQGEEREGRQRPKVRQAGNGLVGQGMQAGGQVGGHLVHFGAQRQAGGIVSRQERSKEGMRWDGKQAL